MLKKQVQIFNPMVSLTLRTCSGAYGVSGTCHNFETINNLTLQGARAICPSDLWKHPVKVLSTATYSAVLWQLHAHACHSEFWSVR